MSCHVYIYSNVLIVEIRCVVYKYAYGRAYMAYTHMVATIQDESQEARGRARMRKEFWKGGQAAGAEGGDNRGKITYILHSYIHVTCM